MFKTQNGWTKVRMIEQINKFPDRKCFDNSENRCCYRYQDNACAAGRFIPDDIYKPYMEGRLIDYFWNKVSQYMPLNMNGMVFFQKEHDWYEDSSGINCVLTKWIEEYVVDV